MRQSGEPYYSHPLEVAYMLAEYTAQNNEKYFRDDLLITAILHDTLEDTTLTFEAIKEAFGETVARQVLDLTRIKENGLKTTAADTIKALWQQKKYEVLLVKYFDRLHNLQTINAKSEEKIKKIIDVLKSVE
jgi:(p)ppGpp synthase/HD superfamily hydrolase